MTLKNLAGRASFHLVKFILFITRIFPVKLSYTLCSFIVFVGTRLRWKRKRIALSNLKIVFPNKAEKERKSIFRDSLKNMLKNYFEMAFIVNGKYSAKKISEMASATGLEHLNNLKKEGQGALLYSGHFGNFPLMVIWLALNGYPVAAIYKEPRNFPDDFVGNIMRKFNVIPFKYKGDSSLTTSVIRALRGGKIVLIQNDQSHPGGIYVNFFNKLVPTPAGPAILAKRVDVPIIPAFICRDINNHHKITILSEIHLQEEADHEKFMLMNTQLLIDWIASKLLEHPTEWLWLHNRWKMAKPTDAFSQTSHPHL